MDLRRGRSKDVTTLAASPPVADARLSFDAVYRENRDAVFGYVAGMLGDRHAAEDVTALAFERAFRKRSSFRPARGTPRAWLFTIARNAALDELRRRKRAVSLEIEPGPDAPGSDDDAERALRRAALRVGLASLAPRDRELIALKFHAGLDNAELAQVLGCSPTNAGTRLHRAVEKLRKAMTEHA